MELLQQLIKEVNTITNSFPDEVKIKSSISFKRFKSYQLILFIGIPYFVDHLAIMTLTQYTKKIKPLDINFKPDLRVEYNFLIDEKLNKDLKNKALTGKLIHTDFYFGKEKQSKIINCPPKIQLPLTKIDSYRENAYTSPITEGDIEIINKSIRILKRRLEEFVKFNPTALANK